MTDRNHRPQPAREAGVTLVELMIALVVITIGILALSAAQTRSSAHVYAAGRNTRALELAQERLETTRAAGYSEAAADSGVTDGFAWHIGVDSLNVDLKHVVVTVSWTERAFPQTLRLDDLLSNR